MSRDLDIQHPRNMKKVLFSIILSSLTLAQNLDLNALRNMQTKISAQPENSVFNSETKQQNATNVLELPINEDEYVVGPGDVFRMNIISSDNISIHSLTVSPTGDLLIPSFGLVDIDGLSLKSAIKAQQRKVLKSNPTAKVHIQLSQMRQFKIKVIGHLRNPGYYKITPVTRVSDIYNAIIEKEVENDNSIDAKNNNSNNILDDQAKLYADIGNMIKYPELSKRNISLIRAEDTLKADLLAFGTLGKNDYNPIIKQGDIVKIPLSERSASIFGGIKIPGRYEYVKDESLLSIINIAGGFRRDANINEIEITRFTSAKQKFTFSADLADAKNIIIEPEDHIMVKYERDYKRQDVVNIAGEVNYPGYYTIETGKTKIGDILAKAGGYTDKADKTKLFINNESISKIPDREKNRIMIIPEQNRSAEEKAYIKARMLTKKGTIESTSFDHANSLLNLNVTKNDEIIIPENFDYIEVLGAVLKPGRYPFDENISFSKYIDIAGGLTKTAMNKKFIIKVATGQRLRYSRKVTIENGDTIFIPEQLEFNRWTVFKDILATLGNAAALIVVIQNAIGTD